MSARKPIPRDFPSGKYTARLRLPDGTLVDFVLNWDYVQGIAQRAVRNKTRESGMGPVLVKAVRS
jgi:hypothetical protein